MMIEISIFVDKKVLGFLDLSEYAILKHSLFEVKEMYKNDIQT